MEGEPGLRRSRLSLPSLETLALVVVVLAICQAFAGRLDLLRGRNLININTASRQTLAAKAGLDVSDAERLIQLRDAYGRIQSVPLFLRWAGHRNPPLILDAAVGPRLACRTPEQAVRRFLLALIILALTWPAWALISSRLRLEYERLPLLLAYVLTGLGAALQYSLQDPLRERALYWNHTVFLLLALALGAVSLRRGWIRHMARYPGVAFLLAAMALLALGLAGLGFGGARISLFGFQPIEGVKLACAISLAGYLALRAPHLARLGTRRWLLLVPRRSDVIPLLVLIGIPVIGPAAVGDLGPVLICSLLAICLLWAITGRLTFAAVGAVAILLSSGLVYSVNEALPSGLSILGHSIPTGHRFPVRVDMCIAPWSNDHPLGMQLGQALWAVSTNGLVGSGLGLGSDREVPLAHSDLAFAAVAEELGLTGAILVLAGIAVIVNTIFRLSYRCPDTPERYLRQAFAVLLSLQAIVIVSATLGLFPLTGVNVPFVSAGGSALIAFWFLAANGSSTAGLASSSVAENRLLGASRARQVALCRAIMVILLVALPARIAWLEWIRSDAVATTPVRTPDRDGVVRPHFNPRLEAALRTVVRGSIYDRKGRVLATSKPREKSGLASVVPGRFYVLGSDAYHLIGHNDAKAGGPIRIEAAYDRELSGWGDPRQALAAYRLKDLPWAPRGPRSSDVRLSIDRDLQLAAGRAMANGLESLRQQTGRRLYKGAAVVVNVADGSILASVSRPALDPNSLSIPSGPETTGDKEWAVEWDRATQGRYPPGSVFKLITAAAALEAGQEPYFTCSPGASAGLVPDAAVQYGGHGRLSLDDALVVSCNLYFGQLGQQIGAEQLMRVARKAGLTGLPSHGIAASELPSTAIGQGKLLLRPIEIARAVAAIANEGELPPPSAPVKTVGKSAQAISPSVARRIAADMRDVVRRGTARGIFGDLPFTFAGKTGSAENSIGDGVAHGWFVGFAPAERPKVAFAVIVENGGSGRGSAAPIARELLRALPEDLRK